MHPFGLISFFILHIPFAIKDLVVFRSVYFFLLILQFLFRMRIFQVCMSWLNNIKIWYSSFDHDKHFIFLIFFQPHLFCTRHPRVLLPYLLRLLHFFYFYILRFQFIEYNDIYIIYDTMSWKYYHRTEVSDLVDCLRKINWDIISNIMPTIWFLIRCIPRLFQFTIILVVPLGA